MNLILKSITKILFAASLFMTTFTNAQVKEITTDLQFIKDKFHLNNNGNIVLKGYLGNKIDLCITNRIKAQDEDYLVEQFRHRNETKLWQTEFWGKWITSAAGAYKYNHDSELLKIIIKSVHSLMSTQTKDGYIGNYADNSHMEGWDIWGRKYTLLGLLACYDLTGDKNILQSAVRLADHFISEVGPDKKNIVTTGIYRGMPSSSMLEPIVLLYNRTGEKRFLDYAKYIIGMWETSDGPQLISKALAGINVAERFPHPAKWDSWENGQKAYEMMSCYEGLLELYRVTGEENYLRAVELSVKNIIDTEINIVGSGASRECWYHGKEKQIYPAYSTMETCVTMTWMKLCNNLLRLTGKSIYADQIEKSTYNALLASMTTDGSSFAKYIPLEGYRNLSEGQCGMNINCCTANGPRAFVLLPDYAVMKSEDGVVVNLYCQSESQIPLEKNNVLTLRQITNYPVSDSVCFEISFSKSTEFTLSLRIPDWSNKNLISVNGELVNDINAGTYKTIKRLWKNGDKIILKLDLSGRIENLDHHYAIVRGPIVLARDSRANDGFVDETSGINFKAGPFKLTPDNEKPENVWMSFSTSLIMGSDWENKDKVKNIHFYDFASAGNAWNSSDRYKVWQTETLEVRKK